MKRKSPKTNCLLALLCSTWIRDPALRVQWHHNNPGLEVQYSLVKFGGRAEFALRGSLSIWEGRSPCGGAAADSTAKHRVSKNGVTAPTPLLQNLCPRKHNTFALLTSPESCGRAPSVQHTVGSIDELGVLVCLDESINSTGITIFDTFHQS